MSAQFVQNIFLKQMKIKKDLKSTQYTFISDIIVR